MMTPTETRLSASQILSNREICPGYFRMRIACDQVYQDAMPGQFVMVRLAWDRPLPCFEDLFRFMI